MSPRRKGEWGQGSEESAFSPSQLQHQAFSTLKALLEMACSAPSSSMELTFLFRMMDGAPRLTPCPPRFSWLPIYQVPVHLHSEFVGRGGGSRWKVTSPLGTPNTLEAYRGWASGSEPDFTT